MRAKALKVRAKRKMPVHSHNRLWFLSVSVSVEGQVCSGNMALSYTKLGKGSISKAPLKKRRGGQDRMVELVEQFFGVAIVFGAEWR